MSVTIRFYSLYHLCIDVKYMCSLNKEKLLAQWVCTEKCMFALHVVAVAESVFIIWSDGMLSLCMHAADGR